MNEWDVRRRLLADPRNLDAETAAHVRADTRLAALRDALLAADNAVAGALGDITPPTGLSERIILRARHRRGARWGLALAASLVLATAVAFVAGTRRPESVAVAMLDHVIESPEELTDNAGIAADVARASFKRIGVSFRDAGYHIRHISECVVAGRTGRHLVIDTPDGLATLLVLPIKAGEMARSRTLGKGNFLAVVMPQSDVAIAAIGPAATQPQKLEALARQMFTLES